MIRKLLLTILTILFLFGANAQETFQSLFDQGNKEIEANNYSKALVCFEKSLKVGNDDQSKIVWVATMAGVCASNLKQESKVLKYNNIAIENGSTDIILFDQQIDLAKKLKDKQTEEKVLLIARKLDGYFQKYTIKLLYYYYNNQKNEETIKTADEVLAFKPGHINSQYFKGVALNNLGKQQEAIDLFKTILATDPENAKVNAQLGLVFYNCASAVFDKANKHYKSLKEPTRMDYTAYRKEIRKSIPDYETCLPYFKNAVKSDSGKYIQDALKLAEQRLNQMKQE